jgi:aerobic-type carbon monoxide dehydrogenase small subunit (CoxS/CutS family)
VIGVPGYELSLTVNGRVRTATIAPYHTLLDVLRDELGLTGSKECCLVGECGSCTVMLDGRSVDACLVLAAEADGGQVITVEGLTHGGELSRLQRAFLETGAAQCGFCIPGQLMSAHALLGTTPRPTRAQVEEGIAGNYCRCAGYQQIIEAVLLAADPAEWRDGTSERVAPDSAAPAAAAELPDQAATPDAELAPQ